MGKWIKQNLILVSGILLPVLLVGGFFILNRLPGALVNPPAHDFLLVSFQTDYQNQRDYYLTFEVRDGRLSGRVSLSEEGNQYFNRQDARIFLYRASRKDFEEITFDLPDGLDQLEESVPIDLAITAQIKLDKRKQSPEGYLFEYLGYGGHGGLLGEIFGMGRRYEGTYALKKGDYYFELPELPIGLDSYQNDVQFMGWVVDEDTKP